MNSTKNFLITITKKGDIIVNTKNYDWKMEFSATSNHGQILKYFTENNTEDEVNELLTEIYYVTTTMLTNIELTRHIRDFFEKKLKDADVLQEISKEEDDEHLKIVKDDTIQDS